MKEKLAAEIYFTPREAAEHLNLSLSAIKNYIYANKLKTLKTPGGHHRISKSDLLAAMGEGEELFIKSESPAVSMEPCCAVLVNVFKLWGPSGGPFIIHSKSVSEIACKLSKALGLTDEDIAYARIAGLVHDIGHIGIDRRLLLKSGPLTPREYESIKAHPGRGEELLNSIKGLKETANIVSPHHERMDGTGYARGLKGDSINKIARVISIAEAYDSMVSGHSYKEPISKDMAISELIANKGLQFDWDITEIFIKII